MNVTAQVEVSALSDAELEARTRARLLALGIEVTGPLLLTQARTLAGADTEEENDDENDD